MGVLNVFLTSSSILAPLVCVALETENTSDVNKIISTWHFGYCEERFKNRFQIGPNPYVNRC